MGLVVGLVAIAAAATSIAAIGGHHTTVTRRLEAAACAGVKVPTTAPAGSSIVLYGKGTSEATALAGTGNPALVRSGTDLSHALEQSDNAEPVISALTDAAKECRILGLHTSPGS